MLENLEALDPKKHKDLRFSQADSFKFAGPPGFDGFGRAIAFGPDAPNRGDCPDFSSWKNGTVPGLAGSLPGTGGFRQGKTSQFPQAAALCDCHGRAAGPLDFSHECSIFVLTVFRAL